MAKIKLALVNWWPEPAVYPPLGLAYIASYLERYGDGGEIKIIDTQKSPLKEIIDFKPDLVGLTCVTFNYEPMLGLAKELKSRLNVPLIMGGPHLSALPGLLPAWLDISVRGEGEETVLELVRFYNKEGRFSHEGLAQISGITYRQDGEVVVNPAREFINPLDRIPPPSRHQLAMNRYLKFNFGLDRFKRGISILSSRGCPYKCIFCQSGAYWGKPRLNSARYMAGEISSLHKLYRMEVVSVIDDLFIISRPRIEELIKELEALHLLGQFEFWVDGRVNLIDPLLVGLLKKLNCTLVSLGIESASDRLLEYLKKDGVTASDNLRAIQMINSQGMGVFAQVMIGIPGETEEEIRLTENFLKEVIKRDRRNSVSISVITPYPGTPLWDYARGKGLVSETMDWSRLEAKPHRLLRNKTNFIYLNDSIPRAGFLKIVARVQSLLDYQAFSRASSQLSLRDKIKKVVFKPRRVGQLIKALLKTRL